MRLLCLFSTHSIWGLGNRGWKRYSRVYLGNQSRSIYCFGHHREEPCLTQISSLKRYNSFKCASTALETLRPTTPKFRKVTVARYEFEMKHCLTLEINRFILIKHFGKTSPCPDKTHTFSYMFQNYFQIFWKSFTRQCMSMTNTGVRNYVQCSFIHQTCKTWFKEYRRGAVYA